MPPIPIVLAIGPGPLRLRSGDRRLWDDETVWGSTPPGCAMESAEGSVLKVRSLACSAFQPFGSFAMIFGSAAHGFGVPRCHDISVDAPLWQTTPTPT